MTKTTHTSEDRAIIDSRSSEVADIMHYYSRRESDSSHDMLVRDFALGFTVVEDVTQVIDHTISHGFAVSLHAAY